MKHWLVPFVLGWALAPCAWVVKYASTPVFPAPKWRAGEVFEAAVTRSSPNCMSPFKGGSGPGGVWVGAIRDEYGRTDGVYSPWPVLVNDHVTCQVWDIHDPSIVIQRGWHGNTNRNGKVPK